MSARKCSKCGGEGHYAKTCGRRESAAPTAAPTAATTTATAPKPVEKVRASTATAPTATTAAAPSREERKAERARKQSEERAQWIAAEAERKQRRESAEAREYPWNHVLREGRSCSVDTCRGCDGFLVRHTWQHDVTGERIVVTVPLIDADHPAPGENIPLH